MQIHVSESCHALRAGICDLSLEQHVVDQFENDILFSFICCCDRCCNPMGSLVLRGRQRPPVSRHHGRPAEQCRQRSQQTLLAGTADKH
jgi:hypothetical protein